MEVFVVDELVARLGTAIQSHQDEVFVEARLEDAVGARAFPLPVFGQQLFETLFVFDGQDDDRLEFIAVILERFEENGPNTLEVTCRAPSAVLAGIAHDQEVRAAHLEPTVFLRATLLGGRGEPRWEQGEEQGGYPGASLPRHRRLLVMLSSENRKERCMRVLYTLGSSESSSRGAYGRRF